MSETTATPTAAAPNPFTTGEGAEEVTLTLTKTEAALAGNALHAICARLAGEPAAAHRAMQLVVKTLMLVGPEFASRMVDKFDQPFKE